MIIMLTFPFASQSLCLLPRWSISRDSIIWWLMAVCITKHIFGSLKSKIPMKYQSCVSIRNLMLLLYNFYSQFVIRVDFDFGWLHIYIYLHYILDRRYDKSSLMKFCMATIHCQHTVKWSFVGLLAGIIGPNAVVFL